MSIASLEADHAGLRIDPADLRFFEDKATPFGCTNIFEVHIPSTNRVTELVCNALTVEHAIARAYSLPAYDNYITGFAKTWGSSTTAVVPQLDRQGWFSPADTNIYFRHLEEVRALDDAALGHRVRSAVAGCIDAVHLFCPKQCNMACTGCYASAIPIDKHPYRLEDVDAFYEGALEVVAQARALGARTIQTSGDGEMTIFPRFFDILDHIAGQNMQWLIFTAGLAFSSEQAARAHWSDARGCLSPRVKGRIERDIAELTESGERKPTARAFLREIERHKDTLHIYHSIWSARSEANTLWRKPRIDGYDYVTVEGAGGPLQLPSSLFDLMQIFSGEHRARLGIDFPVSTASVVDVPRMAHFIVQHGLKSYFEPIIVTGRARRGAIGGQAGQRCGHAPVVKPTGIWADVEALLVRSLCSFRFLHQPIVKFWSDANQRGFYASPGTGVDLKDLSALGVLESTKIGLGGVFQAMHSPLVVYANYVQFSGCKCNDITQRLLNDREALQRDWQKITSQAPAGILTPEALLQRLGSSSSRAETRH